MSLGNIFVFVACWDKVGMEMLPSMFVVMVSLLGRIAVFEIDVLWMFVDKCLSFAAKKWLEAAL